MAEGQRYGEIRNTISGGIYYGPVLQGRDFRDVNITVTVPAVAPVALAQLPSVVAGFTGRDTELVVMAGLLDPAATGIAMVLAVAGMAGVGKTALAIQAGHAARQRGWFPGGVLFIDLHGYDDVPVEPEQALDALLRALGVAAEHIPPGAEARAGLYRSVLAGISEPVLVIADNASSEGQARPLLPGSGPHRVVVTSRRTLGGLEARLVDVKILDDAAGVMLLDAVLRAARPDDERISGDLGAAERLAGICGGLPLAMRLVAALLVADAMRSVSELADDLSVEQVRLEGLRYDNGGHAGVPSVAAAFELSYRRLDETSARVFRALSLNPGPDLSAAAVAVLADLPAIQIRALLSDLARAHLIEAAPGVVGRWRMHDLLRLYAQRQSDAHAETDRREYARDRLLDYYLRVADAANDHLRALPGSFVPEDFTGQADALAWLDAERPNLVAAVKMAADTCRNHAALDLAMALAQYFLWRRRFDDLLVTAAVSLNSAHRLSDRHGEGGALGNLGNALEGLRRFEEAIGAHQDAIAIFRETGDRHLEGQALGNLGNALEGPRRFGEAIDAHQHAAAIFREIDDRHGEGMALGNLGVGLGEAQRFEEAIGAHQDAIAIFRETGDRHHEGQALGNLSNALGGLRRFEEAIGTLQAAAALYRETGDRYGEGQALSNLGAALEGLRRFEEAIGALQDAIALYREIGDRYGEGQALGNLGVALRDVRRFEEAITTLQMAAAIFWETGDRHSEGRVLNNLGLALWDARRVDEAVSAHQNAAAIFRETGDRDRERQALNDLKTAQGARGRRRWSHRR
jgi:tetratricopeptide (TPR) repeat protein